MPDDDAQYLFLQGLREEVAGLQHSPARVETAVGGQVDLGVDDARNLDFDPPPGMDIFIVDEIVVIEHGKFRLSVEDVSMCEGVAVVVLQRDEFVFQPEPEIGVQSLVRC